MSLIDMDRHDSIDLILIKDHNLITSKKKCALMVVES